MSIKLWSPCCEVVGCPNHTRLRPTLFGAKGGIVLNGRRHCSEECFAAGVLEATQQLLRHLAPRQRRNHRVPLGLVLLQQGLVSEGTLKAALGAQREAGHGRVGEWLRRLGGVSEPQITRALGAQWACPVFPLQGSHTFLKCAEMVPLAILESVRMIPAHFLAPSRLLYVAFADRIDPSALYAIERMDDCHTHPCLVDESAFDAALDQIRRQPRNHETCFDSLRDPREVARTACNHALSLQAREARLTACAEFLWMRLMGPRQEGNLTFKMTDPLR
jgi:hypothetical protein